MIPTMMVFGLVLGRWWRVALAGAAFFWPTLLLVTGVLSFSRSQLGQLALAALLGLVNAAVGVAVHQVLLLLVRRLRGTAEPRPSGR